MSRDILLAYFDDIEQALQSLPNSYVEMFDAVILTPERANLKIRVRFNGRQLLAISEALLIIDSHITHIDYRYHFQDENNTVIFRYDSTPHFPDLPTFPHHKHLPDTVIAADKPDIIEVFQEASILVQLEN